MLKKYEGIVFKSIPYSESSLILDIYTKEAGLGSFIVSGVRKKKSSKANLYKAMNIIDFVAYAGEKSKLYRIKEASFNHLYKSLNKDIYRSTMAMFMIDLCRNSIKESEANTSLYEFLNHSFKSLDESETLNYSYHLWFALELTKHLGFYPDKRVPDEEFVFDLEHSNFRPSFYSGKYVLSNEGSQDWLALLEENTSVIQNRKVLMDSIIMYYQLHVPGFKTLKSLDVLRTIFS